MIRLDKLLSHGGLGSRSSVKKLLRSGAVTVNDNSVPEASIRIDDENDVVGLLHLADVTVIGQSEKQLLSSMNRNFVSCETSTTTPEVLRLMADNETTVAIITKNKRIYGLVNLSEIISAGQSCQI